MLGGVTVSRANRRQAGVAPGGVGREAREYAVTGGPANADEAEGTEISTRLGWQRSGEAERQGRPAGAALNADGPCYNIAPTQAGGNWGENGEG